MIKVCGCSLEGRPARQTSYGLAVNRGLSVRVTRPPNILGQFTRAPEPWRMHYTRAPFTVIVTPRTGFDAPLPDDIRPDVPNVPAFLRYRK
jgi:hypothetical protein